MDADDSPGCGCLVIYLVAVWAVVVVMVGRAIKGW